MDILICQSCGAILKGTGKTCNACGAFISTFSPTILSGMSGSATPLQVDVKPDVLGLERVVSKRQMTMLLERNGGGNGNGNGHGNGNGNGKNAAPPAPEPTSIDMGSPVIGGGTQAAAPAPANPWEKPIVPVPQPEPTELNFAASSQAQAAPGGMSFPGAANAVAATQLPNSALMQGAPGQTLVQTSGGNNALVSTAPTAPGQTSSEGQFLPSIPIPADGPPVQGGVVDFFNTAPPPVSGDGQNAGGNVGQTVATAAMGAAVGVAVGVAAAKTFDFFNNPGQPGAAEPGAQPAGSPPQDYTMAERSDFFAAPGAPQAAPQKTTAEAQPSHTGGSEFDKPNNSQQNMPAVDKHSFEHMVSESNRSESSRSESSRSESSSNSNSAPGGFDFFAAAPMKEKRPFDDDFSSDRGHTRPVKDAPSSVSLYADEDEDVKPKIARPRGYTPKEGKDGKDGKESKESSKSKSGGDDDDEDVSFYKDKPPARRSFSGNDTSKKKKSADDDDDDDKPVKVKKEGFLSQEVSLLGMSMTRQNQLMLIAIFGFVGIVFFNMLVTLFGGIPTGGPPPRPRATSLPNLSGDWKIRYTEGPNNSEHLMAVLATQKGLDIAGRGSDEYGEFNMTGTVIPPDRIQLKKKYRGQEEQKPVIFEGQFVLGSEPLYSSGRWTLKHVVGKFLHAQVKEDGGGWEANYYVRQQAPTEVAPTQIPAADLFAQARLSWESLDMSKKLLFAAFCVIAVAILALIGSLAIFGPSGKMNIWEKQKYIPSQFKAQHNKMVRELSKPLRPGGLPLGQRKEWRSFTPWVTKDLAITPEIRENDPHLLILGASDKGKTRLMAKMVAHDIESADRAVVVIDSDGGLTDIVTRWVSAHPKGREMANRIVLLDPTYKNNSMGYNPLEMPEDEDLQSAASSLVYGFKAIYTEPPGAQSQWNQQTANILRNAALLLMVNGKTLTDLPALLNDNDFRDVLLESIEKKKKEKAEYITLLDTWGQYKRLARTDQWINWVEPILNRVGPMLSDSRIRSILTKPIGDIKLKQIIKEKKVLIVKVAKGQLDQNANLLGSLIVTGLKQAALSLANEGQSKQPPVALYLDEFDNFIEKDTIEAITSETDKFKIGFIGCIKTLQHLPEDFRNQLIIAVGTMACFALAKKDGDLLGPQMFRVDGRKIKHQTIQNFFNKVNTSPQFELISDEEKLNIDRVVGQEERTFFCYRVGTVAGVFNLISHDFNDTPDSQVKKKIMDKMHGSIAERDSKKKDKDAD